MIRMMDLTFCYSDAATSALKRVNLEIGDGEFVLVTGASGSGKSSLCRCFNGLIPHFYGGKITGRVEVGGLDVMQHPTKELATRVGMVIQDPENQLVAMDVEREVVFGLENLAFPRDVISKRLEESLDTLGISDLRYRPLHELSGGEKQKVAIASVLALHPSILVLDEPTSELDPKGAEEVLSIARRLNDELGITVILVEHRLDRVVHFAERMIVLDKGTVLADGNPRDVLDNGVIDNAGIGVPPVVKLVQRLKAKGLSSNSIPLTIKEGRFMLDGVFKGLGRATSLRDERSEGKPIIEVEKLWHAYPEGITALKNIGLVIREGEFVAIMGRNASGKTTLVKHMNGLLRPTKGRVTVAGIDTDKAPITDLAHKVGFVFQNPNDHLFADTVEEEIAFTVRNLGYESREIASRVDEMLERFDLGEYRRQYPRSLSGGEKQRVALASVLVAYPQVLILDEPTRGLEQKLKSELMGFLHQYRGNGNTVILVTHDVETAAGHADRVILLSEGRIVVDGDRRSVLSQALLFSPQINRLVQAFEKYGVSGNLLTVDEVLELLP